MVKYPPQPQILEEEAKVEEPTAQIQEEVKEEASMEPEKQEEKPSRTSSTASLREAEGKTTYFNKAEEISKEIRRVTFNEVP